MESHKLPWYAGVVFALIEAGKQRYPDYAQAFNVLFMGMVGHFGGNLLHTLKNGGNGNGNGKGPTGGTTG